MSISLHQASIAKLFLFSVVAAMLAFVLWHNERPLLDASSPQSVHLAPAGLRVAAHAFGAALALALGALQFLARKGGRTHRTAGRIYVAGVFLAGPFAIWMAAIISPWFLFAFTIVQAGIWMLCTGIAFWAIRRGNIDQHREWMMRSYAIVLIFLEGRVLMAIPVLAAAGLDAVVFVNWLSLTLTLIGVELVIQWSRLSARPRNSRGLPTISAV
jgi:uncharacterized membrane protein